MYFGFLLLEPSSAREGDNMIKTTPEQNKTLVLQAFDTLFNKRDYKAAERYWSSFVSFSVITSRVAMTFA